MLVSLGPGENGALEARGAVILGDQAEATYLNSTYVRDRLEYLLTGQGLLFLGMQAYF